MYGFAAALFDKEDTAALSWVSAEDEDWMEVIIVAWKEPAPGGRGAICGYKQQLTWYRKGKVDQIITRQVKLIISRQFSPNTVWSGK